MTRLAVLVLGGLMACRGEPPSRAGTSAAGSLADEARSGSLADEARSGSLADEARAETVADHARPPSPASARTATRAATTETPAARQLREEGYAYLDARVDATLEAAVVASVGPEVGPALSQVVHRALVWWMTPRTDLRPGDRIEAIYKLPPGEEPRVVALWIHSRKLGGPRSAVLVELPGRRYTRWAEPVAPSGAQELELRLEPSPIAEYEQITSLINDGRRHKGVDFKASVGTPVLSPWDGEVVRKTWNFRANGNSIEVEYPQKGVSAYFLHLASVDAAVKPGARVRAGQTLGLSGNTGHSTAPHLHYQLVRGEDRVVDPFKIHEKTRLRLTDEEAARVNAELQRFSALRPSSPGREG